MITLRCYDCGEYEIRFVNKLGSKQNVYIFACVRHARADDLWEPLDAIQLQEIGMQIQRGRDFPPRPKI